MPATTTKRTEGRSSSAERAGRRGMAQQPEVERIAGTSRQVRIVGQDDRREGAGLVGHVEGADVHAAFGQRLKVQWLPQPRGRQVPRRETP